MAEWKKIITSGSNAELSQITASTEALLQSVDINGGTIDGITSLTAGGNLDIGSHNFRAANILADSLTSGRVVFAGSNGILSDDADLTFSGATLTGTSGSFGAIASVNISGSLRGDANLNELDVAGSGSFESITVSGHISGSFVGDGSGLTGVGFQIDELSNSLTAVDQSDLLVVADADASNEEKKITFSNFEDEIFGNVSGDATIAAGGALSLADNSVGNDEMADNAIGNAELKQNEDITLQALTTTNNLSVGGSATITGDLTVNGTTTTVTSTNVAISDKFMFLASGSTATDGGIIVSHAADNSGSAFGYDVSEERWAFQSGSGAEGMNALAPDAYAVAAVSNDNVTAYRKNGNIRVEGGEIFIYVE